MLFNSLAFAIFLPIVFCIFWLSPQKIRYIVLFLASYYFYMSWNVKYVVLILFTTIVSYVTALLLEHVLEEKKKRLLLVITLIVSLGVLFFFKYWNFFFETVQVICSKFALPVHDMTLALLLPVGISFYTFQTLSYVIDVYRGKVQAEKNFIVYAAFISFFPQLVAGPIERTENLLPQIKKQHTFSYEQSALGLKMIAWGLFKKLVIADNLAVYVDKIYSETYYYKGFSLFLATLFFAIQIYCDFSGYSEIAIGCAKLFSIDLMVNFKSPYFSRSLKEFWSNWHISLSTWFRDYVYIPLGGNRKGSVRTKINLVLTFLVSGLWHGANMTFVVWGLLHGVGQVVESFFKKHTSRIITMLFVVLAWSFFRAATIEDAFYVLKNMWVNITTPITYIKNGFLDLKMTWLDGGILAVSNCLLFVFDFFSMKGNPFDLLNHMPKWSRYVIYYSFILMVLLFASFNSKEFVYFQF